MPGPASWIHRTRELSFVPPLNPDNLYGHLVATAVPGIEEWHDGAYRRTLRLPGGAGIVVLPPPVGDTVVATLLLTDPADEDEAVRHARRILDLDADPAAVEAVLGADEVLRPLVEAAPGRRVPGSPDPDEFAVRAVLGQQVSTAAARTHAARMVLAHGTPLPVPSGSSLTHLFPSAHQLTALTDEELGMPASRKRTLHGLVAALADGVRRPARRPRHRAPGPGCPARDRALDGRLGGDAGPR